jgi:GATA-binding protein
MMQSSPSGIAQLRKSSENNLAQPDAMNLDDFIFSDNSGSPINFASPEGDKMVDDRSGNSMASAIPIKSRKEPSHQTFVPQSVPVQPVHQATQGSEFNYVNRHLRKTSIDDRRVSNSHSPSSLCDQHRILPFVRRKPPNLCYFLFYM